MIDSEVRNMNPNLDNPFSEIKRVNLLSKTVAFPNRKSYFFDNKLEFSDIKIAIGQGFR